jgi:serine phosphatase RsbU (regulator of sigma subunit)/putative methionine-R-sulfoxide reductase with GAF domain
VGRERVLIVYCLAVAALGWFWLMVSGSINIPLLAVGFALLALLIELLGFRIPPADPHSLVGVVLLAAVLSVGATNAALIAALSGLVFGVLEPFLYNRPRSFYLLVARPLFRSGARIIAILLGATVARLFAITDPWSLVVLIPCYLVIIQSARAMRELIQGSRSGVATWWHSSWRPIVWAETLPLPFAALLAEVYIRLHPIYFLLSSGVLLATTIAVRRAVQSLRLQRRSVRELALLNEASRAIIRAELDADALSELIYREASKVVDTSSFHLGLFEAESDRYTLMVRIQDRVRLPRLTVDLPSGDGIVGWMRQTGRALLVEDFASEMARLPARPRYQSDRPPRSGIYVPLLNGETVIGSISIQSYQPRTFDTDDMRVLSLIADQAAVAIAKARAFDDARQRAIQLQAIHEVSERITAILDLDELLPSVVRLIREHFGYHPVHIFTLEDAEHLIFRASTAEGVALANVSTGRLPLGKGLVGSAAKQAQPLIVDDVRKDTRYIGDDSLTRSELAVPLRFGDQIIGVLDLQSQDICRFGKRDLFVMQTMADQIAVAIESARAFAAQREEAWTLNALLQVAENIARTDTLTELLSTVVRLPPLLLGCDRCYCIFVDQEQACFTPRAAYGLSETQRMRFLDHSFAVASAPLLEEVARSVIPTAVEDAGSRRYVCPQILEAFGGQTVLVLPLWSRGVTLGLLVADYNTKRESFSAREMTLYNGVANQIAGALESALLAQEAAQAARLEEELQVARGVQTALLPSKVPEIPGWNAAATWLSARIVGGDFFDYWHLDQQFGFVIADVSDKGVPAAMFMALSRSLVRAAALDGSPPEQALVRANRWITRDSESGMFVTIFYGLVDPATGVLTYCCAGHNPPLLIRADGSFAELTTPGIALGVLEEITLHSAKVQLAPGDLLLCYTDGVTEAFDANGEQFGVPRLIEVAQRHRTASARSMIEAITTALDQFANGIMSDDVTLLVIRRDGEAS